MLPERSAAGVALEKMDAALGDALFREGAKTTLDERFADAAFPVRPGDGEVVEIAAPAVMSRKNSADEPVFIAGHEAQSGIPLEVAREAAP